MTDIKMPEFPKPDGTAEANCIPVRGSDGLVYREYEEVPAWSRPLVEELMREAVRLNAQADAKPMFWVRRCSDGGYEGPIHDSRIEDTRKQSGAWHPLYLAAPAAPQPAPVDQNEARDAARWRYLAWHIGVAWNEQGFTSLVRIVSDKHREMLGDMVDRMMAGDWPEAAPQPAQQTLTYEKDALLRQALEALEGFTNITNDSQGVKGYHLNGDIAEWDEFDEVDAASNTIEAIRQNLGVKND